jgi:uncharacterized protein YpmB
LRRRSKIIWGLLLISAIMIFVGARFFTVIQAEEWSQEDQAVQVAKERTTLTEATNIEPYVGDADYMIVYGKDKDGQSLIVWVSEDDVHAEYVSAGITRDTLKKHMLEKNADIRFKRLRPGKLEGLYVWEVYYETKEDGKYREYYDYYRFSDGVYIDTYSLSLR